MEIEEIENRKESEKKAADSEKPQEKDDKIEGIANDIVSTIEPFLRAGEKLFNLDRSQVGMTLVRAGLSGKIGNIAGIFGQAQKKTRMQKMREAVESTLYILLLLMLFFWLNYGIWRWLR